MRFFMAISRFAFGLLFIISGFLKAIDPIGTALKIKEYFGVMGADFLDFLSIPAGILLAAAEFLSGVAILKGLRIQLFSKIALGFISFFTLLTLWIAIANPISDCGCFGEAIHLSNTGTFLKNLGLLVAALVIFWKRKEFKPIASAKVEWGYLVIYTLLILVLQGYSLRNIPQIDFGIYKPGTDLIATQQTLQEREYETTFIYKKDGVEKTFSLDSLPDDTWEFVDSRTVQVGGATEDSSVDFSFIDARGNSVGNEILSKDGPVFFISIYNARALGKSAIRKIRALADTLKSHNLKLYIVSANSAEETQALFAQADSVTAAPSEDGLYTATEDQATGTQYGIHNPISTDADYEILYSDYKAVISFNRSSGGLTYVNSGIIVKKWARGNYPTVHINRILSQDPEIITATTQIDEQLFAEVSLFIILFLIVIIRFISKIIYNRHIARLTHLHKGDSAKESQE